jgi:hypothetical protein
MNKYNDIEIQTAKNLLKRGFKWIAMDSTKYGNCLYAYTFKPNKGSLNGIKDAVCWRPPYDCGDARYCVLCSEVIPIFQSVCANDKEPTSLEDIVHPKILDDAEKQYLSAVIKPFRDSIKIIKKHSLRNNENILIFYDDAAAGYEKYIDLPYFKKGTMYKGMENNRNYTLKELGL